MEWYLILALVGAGFVAGFINTVAGGGSTLTLPLLMFLGLDTNMANGTNRIGILLQGLVGTNTFRRKKYLDFKTDWRLAVPAVLGSIVGAMLAVELNERLMRLIIGALMVVMLLVVLLKPEVWVKERVGQVQARQSKWQYLLFFAIGFYGGFIQMGVGFFLMAGLVLGCGFDLVKTNAVKTLIVFLFTIFALAIFIFHQQVDWLFGLILAAGNMLGAWAGAHFTMRGGAKYVRWVLIVAMLIVTVKLFWSLF